MSRIPSSIPVSSPEVLMIIGPSGVGKTTILERLERDGLIIFNRSHTTRPKRRKEDNDHIFIDDDRFQALLASGHFLGITQPFGLPYRYGYAPFCEVPGRINAMNLRSFVVDEALKHYPSSAIYHIEAPIERLDRLIEHEQRESTSERRAMYEKETAQGVAIAHRCFQNIDLDACVQAVKSALRTDFSNILN